MPGFLGGNKAGAAAGGVPPGMNIKNALIQAAPLFASMAAGYSSGRGPYAYMDQGIAGIQANQKAKRDEEAAAAAAAAFGSLRPGGNGVAGGGGGYQGSSAPPVPIDPNSPGILSADTMKALGKGPVLPAAPEGWDAIKNGIFAGESGGDYNALYGYSNRPGGKYENVKLVDMTVDQALQFADPSGEYGQGVKGQIGRVATPMGAYQIVGTTLKAAKEGLGLTGNERMTPELQDALGQWIYGEQGTGAWEGYRGPIEGGAPSDPVDPMSDPYVQKLMTVMSMPGITPEQQAVIQLQLQSRIQTITTPPAGAEEEAARAMRARDADLLGYTRGSPEWNQYVVTGEMPEPPKAGYTRLTPEQVATIPGLDASKAWQVSPEGKIEPIGGAGTSVTVDMGGGPELGKLSTDYGYVLGPDGKPKIDQTTGLPIAAPVPGSPAYIEEQKAAEKAQSGTTKDTQTADIVLGKLDELDRLVDESTVFSPATGFGAETAAGIGGTRAADTKATIDTIAANMAFDALAEMRAASPTGGALGAITEKELALLSSTLASLSQLQSPEQFKQNVKQLRAIYTSIKAKADAYPNASQFGFGATLPPTGNTTSSGVTWSVAP